MPNPTLTFNPLLTVAVESSITILDAGAIVNDGGNTLGAIRIKLGPGVGSLAIVNGGIQTTSGTIGTIAYLYDSAKRLLSLTSSTATGADFTQVLRLVGYVRSSGVTGDSQSICINLGAPLYSPNTGHYYEHIGGAFSWESSNTAANAKTFFGLTGYLATVTSASENNFLADSFTFAGWIGGTSVGTSGSTSIWKWVSGPEANTVFWNGLLSGSAPSGQYANWKSGEPNNYFGDELTNGEPYVMLVGGTSFVWTDARNIEQIGYYTEYSTASGTGDDGLSGSRSAFIITVDPPAATVALIKATTAIEVSLTNGVVTSAIGVPLWNVTIGATNATHIQVSIDLGTNNAGKRRQAQGFRLINGSERDLISTRTRIGEIYTFVYAKTSTEGFTSVNLILN